MIWALLAAVAALAVLAGFAVWVATRPPDPVPERADADAIPLAVRGYRMEQVDEVLDHLEARIRERDTEIAAYRGEPGWTGGNAGIGFEPPDLTMARPAALTNLFEESAEPLAVVEDTDRAPSADPGQVADPLRDAGPRPGADPLSGTAPARDGLEPVDRHPLPWRHSDLLAPLAYLAVAAWVMIRLLTGMRTGYLSQGVQDQQAFEWYFGATAHNIATFSNPLFSDLQNFPDGVNLMANAAMLGLGVPLAPLTLLAGPQVTFVVVELLGLALTASAWFWLFRRRLPVHPAAAFVGGALAGFGPGMISHANGHPNFVVQALVPVILDRLLRLCEGRRPVRDGVILGLLVAWQVLIGEEVLLLTAVGALVGGTVLLLHRRLAVRTALPGVAVGGAVALALTALPLWWQFFGPQSYTSIWHPPGGNDLAQLWGRATRSLGADPWAAAALSMNRTEENSFFGIPLLVAAAATVGVLWRRVSVRALAVVVVLSCWLSLGEEVTLNGRALGIPAPWALLDQLPVVQNVLPTRFALVALPALAALLALGVETARRAVARAVGAPGPGLALAGALATLALLPVVPTPLVVDPRAPMPAFFADGSWKRYVDDGGSVLAVPPPYVADTRALEWQAQARWGFPVVAGYFVGPDSTPERGGQYGATPNALTTWLGEIDDRDVPAMVTPEQRSRFDADLRQGRVDLIVLPADRASAPALLASLSSAYGEPVAMGGVYLWDVRPVSDVAR